MAAASQGGRSTVGRDAQASSSGTGIEKLLARASFTLGSNRSRGRAAAAARITAVNNQISSDGIQVKQESDEVVAAEQLRHEVTEAQVRLDGVEAEVGALRRAARDIDASIVASRASAESLHTELLNAKAERILRQAEANGDVEEEDGIGGRDLSTADVDFDAVFDGGDAGGGGIPRHYSSASHHGGSRGSFEQASSTLALPPAARVEMARLRAALEKARAQLEEVVSVWWECRLV